MVGTRRPAQTKMALVPKFAASGLIMYDMDHWKTTLRRQQLFGDRQRRLTIPVRSSRG